MKTVNRLELNRTSCPDSSANKLNSILKRIQTKLVAGEENVNVLKNRFDGTNGKIEDIAEAVDAGNGEQSTDSMHARQKGSSVFQRGPVDLVKVRGVLRRFDDLLQKIISQRHKRDKNT